jgi:hypothetical protein
MEVGMLTFVQYLEELAGSGQVLTLPGGEVELLVECFGDQVRQMGRWNASGDGSLDIPVSVIRDAASQLEGHALLEAVAELKAEHLTTMLNSSAAVSLIEKICESYQRYFRDLMSRYQVAGDPAESMRLRDQLVQEVFGS